MGQSLQNVGLNPGQHLPAFVRVQRQNRRGAFLRRAIHHFAPSVVGQAVAGLEFRFQHRIGGNTFGMQLDLDSFVDSDAPDLVDIARPRTERQPIECVQDLSILGELPVEAAIRSAIMGKAGRQQDRRRHSKHRTYASHVAPP